MKKALIITVAGTASRFNKDLDKETLKCLYFEGKPENSLLCQIIKNSGDFDQYVIVGGYLYGDLQSFAEENLASLANRVTLVYNPHFKDYGSGYSLYVGIKAVKDDIDEVVFAEGDLFFDKQSMSSVVNSNLGQTYMELNELDSAQKYLSLASAFFLAEPDMNSDVQFFVDGLNASLALKQDNLAKATKILSKPYVLDHMPPNYLYLHHKGLADLYERKGDYAKALEYQKLTNQYDDSLRNAMMISNVSENELRFKQDTAIVRRDMTLKATQSQAEFTRVIMLLVITLLIVGVIALVIFYRYKSLRHEHQHHQEMNRMVALKMENVRNRFSPHFVFNVLNVFISNIPKNVNVRPLRLLIQVLRTNLLTCDKIAASLDEELQMVVNYASLRHETNPFLPLPVYDIAKDVDLSSMIPSMIIQIPVENALKHAFVGMEETSLKPSLKVKIWIEDDMLRIDVIDNGCGGVGAANSRKKVNSAVSTGTGLRILNSTIEMLNAANKRKIYFVMHSNNNDTDAEDDANRGTIVSIGVPCEYNFDVFQ